MDTTVVRNDAQSGQVAPVALPRVVIIGAGFGGLNAARGFRHAQVDVTVIDRSNHFLFQPLLYQVATAELSPADISAPIRGVLRGQGNTRTVLANVTDVDVERREVIAVDLGDGHEHHIPYDYLIIATGASESYFGHNEWAKRAPGLKSISDATAIRREILLAFETAELESDRERIKALMTFVVVGGGPTGVEMAGAIADLARNGIRRDFRAIDTAGARVLLVEAGPRLLPQFPEGLGKKAQGALRRLGVEVRLGVAVNDVDADGVVIGDEHVRAQTVIWAAGVEASAAAKWLGVKPAKAGRVAVGPDLTVDGRPEIYVLGDTASAFDRNGKPLPGVASVAIQQGHYAAKAISERASKRNPKAPIAPFRYFDRGYLATVGRTYAIGEIGPLQLSGFPAWVVWAGVHIAYLIGFRNRFLVLTQWLWKYLTYQRGARLITRDPRETRAGFLPTSYHRQ
ncbi:MAG TPA: NAD(P)/FAD-dependent oxidoreductase [Ktedonobacterales bacterium]|jgi:NADH dehydrogenase|nr:NAD(P)/FAD-dependent oxidoreductase [Ktedonobacterales bacterium]